MTDIIKIIITVMQYAGLIIAIPVMLFLIFGIFFYEALWVTALVLRWKITTPKRIEEMKSWANITPLWLHLLGVFILLLIISFILSPITITLIKLY